jgi:hypothetical protein
MNQDLSIQLTKQDMKIFDEGFNKARKFFKQKKPLPWKNWFIEMTQKLSRADEQLESWEEQELVIRYLRNKVLGDDGDVSEYEFRHAFTYAKQYIMFGTIPDWLTFTGQLEFAGLTKRYFMWVNIEDAAPDGKFETAPINLHITRENFKMYLSDAKVRFAGWRRSQLITFIRVNIITPLLKSVYGLSVDLNSATYKKMFINNSSFWSKKDMLHFISDYFHGGQEAIVKQYKQLIEKGGVTPLTLMRYRILRRRVIEPIKARHDKRMQHLWKSLKDNFGNAEKDARFKWQSLCQPKTWMSEFENETLQELAQAEGIQNAQMKTKRELCVDLAKRFEELVKKKEEAIPTCTNTQTIGLDALQDVPAEFFYTYTINNKVFCDDIRVLYKYLTQYGSTNPWDRSELPQSIIDDVIEKMEKLKAC